MSGATGFTRAQREVILDRDPMCQFPRCGKEANEVNHRANRGMGGFKGGNTIANGCGLCTFHNFIIEVDANEAAFAAFHGVKISRYADPRKVPLIHTQHGPILLNDDGSWRPVPNERGER